jgi:hypothetical protein
MHFALRRATACDADAIADVYSASFRLLTFLPMLHTIEGYRWFVANVILNDCEVTVAEDKSGIVPFLARQGDDIRLLYTRPDRIGMGAGTQLIDAAKATGSAHSNCGASTRTSVHDAFTKHEVFTRSGLRMVLRTRNRCLTSVIGGNLWRRPASSTRENSEAGARGQRKMPERVSVQQAVHRCKREFSPL